MNIFDNYQNEYLNRNKLDKLRNIINYNASSIAHTCRDT